MASIVAGIGASHSIMLMARLEDWPHFAQVDKERAKYYFDKAGNPTNYEALLAMAPKGLDEILRPGAIRARYERCQIGLAKLRDAVGRIALVAVVAYGISCAITGAIAARARDIVIVVVAKPSVLPVAIDDGRHLARVRVVAEEGAVALERIRGGARLSGVYIESREAAAEVPG